MRRAGLALALLTSARGLWAQEPPSLWRKYHEKKEQVSADTGFWGKTVRAFKLSGYGIFNYFAYDWQTDPQRRDAFDIERLVLYPSVVFTKRIRIDSEIEFEHLGAGVTMEYDRFEEFGEYEMEVLKGGEVLIERLNVHLLLKPWFNFRVGRILIPWGLTSKRHRPRTYFTTTRNEMEHQLCPTNWYENGLEFYGAWGKKKRWNYHLCLVTGLDATGFSSGNWIKRGHQKRFEVQNANDWAVHGRLDYMWNPETGVGASAYFGNTRNNRPTNDLNVDAHVGVYEIHGILQTGPLKARAEFLIGTLQNAEAVSRANRNLSNNLNVKRTPVGSMALGTFAEVGYDVLSFFQRPFHTELDVFFRYDYFDSMFRVEGMIFDNPRWERHVYTFGLNYHLLYELTFKVQYSFRKLGSREDENTFSAGVGFEF